MEVDVFEPVSNIEARTVLSDIRQVAVAQDLGIGIIHAQAMQQFLHRHFLCQCTGVGGMAVRVESALIADTYGVGVVVAGMSPCDALRPAGIEGAVLGDVIVIADGVEAAGLMTGFQLFNSEVLVHSRGAAMHHNQIDVSHDIRFYSFTFLLFYLFTLLPFYLFTFLPFYLLKVLTGADAKSAGYRCEYGDDEVDDCFPIFFFHGDKCFKMFNMRELKELRKLRS